MRYLLIDTETYDSNGGDITQIFGDVESLQTHLREIANEYDNDYSVKAWAEKLELYQIGEAIPVKVERTVLVTFGEAEPAERGPTLGEIVAAAMRPDTFEEDGAAYRYGEGRY